MEYRRLISFGKGGYVISIPKSWVDEHSLGKGSIVMLEKGKGSLSISPSDGSEVKAAANTKSISINVDDKSYDAVLQMLTSAYLNSYSTIHIVGDRLSSMVPELKSYIQRLIALEVFESSRNKLVLRDFLDFSSIAIPEHVRKMDITIRSMLSDMVLCDSGLYEGVISREKDVERLFLVVAKAMRKGTENTSTLKTLKVSLPELVYYSSIASSLGHIANDLQRFVSRVRESKLSKKGAAACSHILGELQGFYLETMKALHKKDRRLAGSLAGLKARLEEEFSEIGRKNVGEHTLLALCEISKNILQSTDMLVSRVGEASLED